MDDLHGNYTILGVWFSGNLKRKKQKYKRLLFK